MRFCLRVLPVLMERARHPTAINVIAITHICSRAYPKKKGRVQLKSQGKRTDLREHSHLHLVALAVHTVESSVYKVG